MTNDDRIRSIDSENQKLNNPEILSHAVAQNTKRLCCEKDSQFSSSSSLSSERHISILRYNESTHLSRSYPNIQSVQKCDFMYK
jgi:hypothetical protein